MKQAPWRALLITALLSTGAFAQKEAERVEPSDSAPKGEVLEWTSAQGQPYWYRLPKKIDAKRPPALVLMLHGSNVPYQWAFWNYPIAAGQFRGGDIVVAPEGMTPGAGEGVFNIVQGKQDGDQIAGLIRYFRDRFPVGRVYLYGHSQGAFFAYWFAGEYPELVDGIVAHAGNVLDVRHTDLSREKVAIGILHGEVDQVVSVECAYRTHEIYEKEGYAKLKLYVVEGLREQAGHWPLPEQAGEMFEWLDQVCVRTPGQAVSVALSELGEEQPELAVVADALADARALLKRYREKDADELAARVAELGAWMETAAAAHAERLLAEPAVAERALPDGPWSMHFVRAERAFRATDAWQDAMKAVRKAAAKHDKAVDKALKGLGKPSRGSFRAAAEALDEGYLAARWDELRGATLKLADDPPKGVDSDDLEALRARVAERAETRAAGREAELAFTAELAAALRSEQAELFAGE